MFLAICLFLPAFIFVGIRNKIMGVKYSREKCILTYFVGVLLLNYIAILIGSIVTSDSMFILFKIQQSNKSAICYLSLTVFGAVVIPYIEKRVKEYVKIEIESVKVVISNNVKEILLWTYAIVLFALNFARIFDNNFWGDEGYSIKLAQMTVGDMIQATAVDVHPPLYYLILQFFYHIGGNNGITYHIVSIVPLGIMLIFGLVAVKKEFGKGTSLLFVTFCSVLSHALTYNVEVRMYSWAALFVLMSFYYLYRVLKNNKKVECLLFVVFSLASSYTHYYALLSVAFFYLFLIMVSWGRLQQLRLRVILMCMGTVIGYLPWLLTFFATFKRTTNSFWLGTIPTWGECVSYLFHSPKRGVLLVLFILCMLIYWLYETGKVCIHTSLTKKVVVQVDITKNVITNHTLWMLAGIMSIVGTIVVGEVVSIVIRPMFILRYLYPVTTVAWLMFSVCLSKFHYKKFGAVAMTSFVLISCMPSYLEIYKADKMSNEMTHECVKSVEAELQSQDVILTNNSHLNWTILDYYFPGVEHQLVSTDEFENIDWEQYDWLFWSMELDEEQKQILDQTGKSAREIARGSLGMNQVYVYKLD